MNKIYCSDCQYGYNDTLNETNIYMEYTFLKYYKCYHSNLNNDCEYFKSKKKLEWDLLPFDALQDIVDVLMFYKDQKGADNWKTKTNLEECKKSLLRHTIEYINGKTYDDESGLNTLAHAGCRLLFCLWFEKNKDINGKI